MLGRNWLQCLKLNWSQIKAVQMSDRSLGAVLDKYKDVFADGLGTVTTVKAKQAVDPSAQPKFWPVPRAAVEQDIDPTRT